MASNSFGKIFRITTFGESHGPAIGVVIDGCPAGLSLHKEEIDRQLALRQPGKSAYTSPRAEQDTAEILSGLFEGKTTGAPIALLIRNRDADSSQYDAVKNIYRPGHANFTYLEKYGLFDYRGGGRASARETAARVAAGAVAKKLLTKYDIDCVAYVAEIGGISIPPTIFDDLEQLRQKTYGNPIFCPDETTAQKIMKAIEAIKEECDSLGGVIACFAKLPVGLGDPVYAKLEAELAYAMLSLPATKGFEIGSGFGAARMKGSEHNDAFDIDDLYPNNLKNREFDKETPQNFCSEGATIAERQGASENENYEVKPTQSKTDSSSCLGIGCVHTATNFAGGTLGGISTGSPLYFRVAFKPTSSIKKPQKSVNVNGEKTVFQLPQEARHDPCVAIRAVPIVEAMAALVLADALLMNRSSRC